MSNPTKSIRLTDSQIQHLLLKLKAQDVGPADKAIIAKLELAALGISAAAKKVLLRMANGEVLTRQHSHALHGGFTFSYRWESGSPHRLHPRVITTMIWRDRPLIEPFPQGVHTGTLQLTERGKWVAMLLLSMGDSE